MKDSTLMIGLTLWTGIDLTAVFKDEDLVAPGIERDHHFTVLYSKDKLLPYDTIAGDMRVLLGKEDWDDLLYTFKEQYPEDVLNHFSLSTFDGVGKDYLVLLLQPESPFYNTLQILNTGLREKYNVKLDFPEYTPHVTLATLEKGKAKNYMFNSVLGCVLEKAKFTLDDFILDSDSRKYQITTENAVSRFFRQLRAKKDGEYYDKEF